MKETLSRVKRQPSEWKKIIANEANDKELISKIHKQLLQLNSRKINDPIKKWAKELNRHFSVWKVYIVKAMIFPVVMYGCERDCKEGRVPKNQCLRTLVLEKIPESPLDSKEIQPVNPKGNQP